MQSSDSEYKNKERENISLKTPEKKKEQYYLEKNFIDHSHLETTTMRANPIPWTANSTVVYMCIRIDGMVHFQHISGFVFYFKFSFENILSNRNPMQHMYGFQQDQGAR